MELQTLLEENAEKGIRILRLNRPRAKNALSILMRREISATLADFRDDPQVRAVIFAGTGGIFSAGFDLKEFMKPELHNDVFESSARYHRDVWSFPKPTIAAIDGPALGGGFDLATLCDIRICSSAALFGHPEIKFGGPPLFTPLRWIVGHGMARDLCLTGRNIDAAEAHRMGLVSEVATQEELMPRALEIARQILNAPDPALALTKSYMLSNVEKDFEASFVIEHDEVFRKTLLKGE